MLLAIDIGNTHTVVGAFDNDKLITHFRIGSTTALTVDEAGFLVSSLFSHHTGRPAADVKRAAICSVVPHLTEIYENMADKYFKVSPLTIGHLTKMPITIDYPEPAEIGADRLANSAAAYSRFKKAVIVVDIGTATTFDVISESGAYMGGIIAPGPQTAGMNLARKAARLFEVRVEKPDRIIGKSTAGAIKSGLYYGSIGMIDNILRNIVQSLNTNPKIIATGGEAESFANGSENISEIIPTLTLEGIMLIADCNRTG